MDYSTENAYWAAVRSEFYLFLQQCFSTVYPNKEFMENWHIDAIVHSLELSRKGRRSRLIINVPPRYLKSFIVSIAFPAFVLGRDPTAKIICVSYSDELAKTLTRDFRKIVESEWYRQLFPEVKSTTNNENEFATTNGGSRYAVSVGGSLTGRGADIIIIDDPIKPEDTHSDAVRNSTNEWFKNTLLTRLDDKQSSVLILVMQRLHVQDLAGYLEAGGGFHKLSFPAIAIKDESIPISDSDNYSRQEGEPLHAKREGLDTLKQIRNDMGSYNFSAQYLQQPECPEGTTFRKKWLHLIDEMPISTSREYLCISIDTALSESKTADYSAMTILRSNTEGHYVMFSDRGRWDYERLKAIAIGCYKRYGKNAMFVVESSGAGISLISFLQKAGIRVRPNHPKHSKETYAAWVVPIFEAGRVFILNKEGHNDWVKAYVDEILSFPHGRYDDQVDSLVQALRWAEPLANARSTYFGIS